MSERHKSYLKAIFGDDAENLSVRDTEIAVRVLGWCISKSDLPNVWPDENVPAICNYVREAVMCASGLTWEDITAKKRGMEITEWRYIAFHVLRCMSNIPKNRLASAIGIKRDHSSVLYALNHCADWLTVDKAFKRKYDLVLFLVKVGMQGGDIKETYETLNK